MTAPNLGRLGLISVWIFGTACGRLTDDEFRRLHAWLTCDECTNGERVAVAAIGPNAVAMLDSALIGPSSGRRKLMRAKIEDAYRFARITTQNEVAYVQPRLENYVAKYQKRAALSLADIGNEPAKLALDRAIANAASRQYRPDVLRVIKFARSMAGLARFTGTIRPPRIPFGRFVSVVAPPGVHFNSQSRATIPDSPFPPGQFPSERIADTLRIRGLADAGFHAIALTNVGAAGDTSFVPFLVTSLRDTNDSVTAFCNQADATCVNMMSLEAQVTPAPNTPVLAFLALQRLRAPRDTFDFFRIQTVGALAVTARLDWQGPADLDLRWRTCNSMIAVGNTNGATSANPEISSVSIPAVPGCWILLVTMAPGGEPGPAFARLQLTTP